MEIEMRKAVDPLIRTVFFLLDLPIHFIELLHQILA